MSLMNLRGQITLAVFLISLSVSILFTNFSPSSQWNSVMISPGALSHHHGGMVNDCSKCHIVAGSGVVGITDSLLHSATRVDQSQKCLGCHGELGPNALNPHSLGGNDWLEYSAGQPVEKRGSSPFLMGVSKKLVSASAHSDEVGCSVCHQEHQGADFDLKTVGNEKCHVCHSKAFHSLKNGHPEFQSYPFQRRTSILFDHNTHFKKHFPGERSDLDLQVCSSCHTNDPKRKTMGFVGYKQACASCHDEGIKEDLAQGLLVAAIPLIDTKTLIANGLDIGDWPESSARSVLAHRTVPVSMKTTFNDVSSLTSQFEKVRSLDLGDLSGASKEDLENVADLARGIKNEIKSAMAGNDLQLTDGFFQTQIPTTSIRQFQQAFLPGLLEATSSANGDASVGEEGLSNQTAEEQRNDLNSVRSGFYIDPIDMSLRYRPVEHADAFLRAFYDQAAQSEGHSGTNPVEQSDPRKAGLGSLSPYTIGRCVKCHSIDFEKGRRGFNWSQQATRTQSKPFTKFTHEPHLINGSEIRCQKCHTFEEKFVTPPQILDADFFSLTGELRMETSGRGCDFAEIKTSNCSQCHQSSLAGDNCLDCHNYHIR
jgi:hypothetical protein